MTDVLWTGGWDSTYRVLDLALSARAAVQPHYIADPGRRSMPREIETIGAIRAAVAARDARAGALLREPRIVPLHDIQPEADIEAAFNRLRAQRPIGIQYLWLARYQRQLGRRIETGVHLDDRARELKRVADPQDYARVFGGFDFPLFGISKLDMEREARAKGFGDLLELTWFCHGGGRVPCGRCIPCRMTIAEGLARRVPRLNRALYYVVAPGVHLLRGIRRAVRT